MKLWIAFGACLVSLPAHAVNKCTQPDGRVVYSDAPCPVATRQAQTIATEPAPRSAPLGMTPASPRPPRAPVTAPAPADAPALQIPPPRRVEFSGLPQSDVSLSVATMDKIRVLGRDCDWALRADKTKMQSCVDFLARVQPKGEFEQIGRRVSQVMKHEPYAARADDLRKLKLHTEEVVQYKESALVLLNRPR